MTHATPPQPDKFPDEVYIAEPHMEMGAPVDFGVGTFYCKLGGTLTNISEGHARYVRADKPADNGGDWVLVPVTPTDEMVKAGSRQTHWGSAIDKTCDGITKHQWQEMLKATPQPPEVSGECCVPDKGEPSFVLLGRDPQAPALVELWARQRENYRPDSPKPAMARDIAAKMREYKNAHPEKGMKTPQPRDNGGGVDVSGLKRECSEKCGLENNHDKAVAFEVIDYIEQRGLLKAPDTIKATSMQRHVVGKDQWGEELTVMGTPNAIAALKAPGVSVPGDEKWRGICKLVEEQGEVLQLLGKLMAYPSGEHPDGKGNLKDRLHEELGDLEAARQYFIVENDFDESVIDHRTYSKFHQFKKWVMSGIRVEALRPFLPAEKGE